MREVQPFLFLAKRTLPCGRGSFSKSENQKLEIVNQKSKIKNPHSGFTLIELLVVLFIIGVLIGLILPAIWKVRETANRGQCAANLRQVAQAVNTYNAQNRRLPYSTFEGPHGDGPNSKAWSWLARLLPYVEQQSIYSLGDIPNKTMQQSGVAGYVVPVFLCPSDPTVANGFRTDAGNMLGMLVGCTSYKGVAGSNWGDDLQGRGRANFKTDWRNIGANGSFDGHSQGDGIFYQSPALLMGWRHASAMHLRNSQEFKRLSFTGEHGSHQ